jgi:hypothetical protein
LRLEQTHPQNLATLIIYVSAFPRVASSQKKFHRLHPNAPLLRSW